MIRLSTPKRVSAVSRARAVTWRAVGAAHDVFKIVAVRRLKRLGGVTVEPLGREATVGRTGRRVQHATRTMTEDERRVRAALGEATRLRDADVERARQLAKTGSREEAHRLLDIVLAPDVTPGHAGAAQLKAQIDDPLRYNPAVSPEHVADVRALIFDALGNHPTLDEALPLLRSRLNLEQERAAVVDYMEQLRLTSPYKRHSQQ